MLQSLINVLHVFICLFLILVVLIQQSRGGGLGGALGGGASQIFGGRGAGNFMTRLTGITAAIFMLTSMTLAYLSSAGDREMKAFDAVQEDR
jgi:preprotein translocase subunit SecG